MECWKDRLAAMVPFYDQDGANATLIYTVDGEVLRDRRTAKWNLKRLARYFSVDLEAARSNYGRFLCCSQGVPLPLSASLVLVPLKTRQAVGKNDGGYGYFNITAVEDCRPMAGPAERSGCLISLAGGHQLFCCYAMRTVQRKINAARLVLERYRLEHKLAGSLAGSSVALPELPPDWWRLIERLIRIMLTDNNPNS